jgi:hypothetical protein
MVVRELRNSLVLEKCLCMVCYIDTHSRGDNQSVQLCRTCHQRQVTSQNISRLAFILHSRHHLDSLDGCVIQREVDCLESFFQHKECNKPYRVDVMSDRDCTISRLSAWLLACLVNGTSRLRIGQIHTRLAMFLGEYRPPLKIVLPDTAFGSSCRYCFQSSYRGRKGARFKVASQRPVVFCVACWQDGTVCWSRQTHIHHCLLIVWQASHEYNN